jgi:hypothetical protein
MLQDNPSTRAGQVCSTTGRRQPLAGYATAEPILTAASRLGDAVARVASALCDIATLDHWAALIHVSRRTLCFRCQAAGVSAKPSLNLGRLARTIVIGEQTVWRPEDFLVSFDPRTTISLLTQAGVRQWYGAEPPTIEELVLHLTWPMPPATRSALMEALLRLQAGGRSTT